MSDEDRNDIEKIGEQVFVGKDGKSHAVPVYQVKTPIKPSGFVSNMTKQEILDMLNSSFEEVWHGDEALRNKGNDDE